jgi:MFS family permease
VTAGTQTVPFRALFGNRDFAVLWVAGAQSSLGDQMARVALSVLVFTHTHSGLATAATYALTYLPAFVGGLTLSALADSCPRRTLLVVCDVIRAVLFAAMAIAGMPLVVVAALLVVAVLAGSPYNAAEPAVVADTFEGERYSAAIGVRSATSQAMQLVGFAVGGLVVAVLGPRATLVLDAATFALSALVLRWGLTWRPAAGGGKPVSLGRIRSGFRAVAGDARLRTLVGFAWLTALWIVPEGLAAPYAAEHGGGATSVGLLLAANPAGTLVGVLVFTRCVSSARRSQLLPVLAVSAGLPLVACAANPGTVVAALLWAACGVLTSYAVTVIAEFVAIVPPRLRGQAIGLASSSVLAAQGLGLLLGGAIAAGAGVAPAIAISGALGSALAVPLALARRRARH